MNTDKSATISLADEDAVKEVLVNTVFGLWDIVNNLLALASPADLKIPRCVNTADEAIALIREHHGKWRAS